MDIDILFSSAMEAYSRDEFQLACTRFEELFDASPLLASSLSDEVVCKACLFFTRSLYEERRDYDKAITFLDQSILIDPHNDVQYTLQGHCYKSLALYAEAVSSFEQAIACYPRPESYVFLAEALECKGESEELVVDSLRKALELDHDYEEAHYLIGKFLFFEKEDWFEAEYHLLRAIDVDQHYGLAHNVIGQLYKKKAMDSICFGKGEFMYYLDKSIFHLEKSISTNAYDIFTFAHLHNVYWMKRNLRKAREIGSEMIKRFPDNAEAYWIYAEFLSGTSSTTHFAERLFKKAIELAPDSSFGYMSYGKALLDWERSSEARLQFERAFALGESEALVFLGD